MWYLLCLRNKIGIKKIEVEEVYIDENLLSWLKIFKFIITITLILFLDIVKKREK